MAVGVMEAATVEEMEAAARAVVAKAVEAMATAAAKVEEGVAPYLVGRVAAMAALEEARPRPIHRTKRKA